MVQEFEQEIDSKVDTGRKRMRWFANHLILFVVGIAVAVSLKLSLYADVENAFFYVPLGAWVGLLAVHANYAMNPMLKRSSKESELKAVIPPSESGDSDRENP
jgi:divalent metal cation (Fe/Co/Zn/Cd) transporter